MYSLDQKKLTTEAKVAPLSELSHLRDLKTFQKVEKFREKKWRNEEFAMKFVMQQNNDRMLKVSA